MQTTRRLRWDARLLGNYETTKASALTAAGRDAQPLKAGTTDSEGNPDHGERDGIMEGPSRRSVPRGTYRTCAWITMARGERGQKFILISRRSLRIAEHNLPFNNYRDLSSSARDDGIGVSVDWARVIERLGAWPAPITTASYRALLMGNAVWPQKGRPGSLCSSRFAKNKNNARAR